MTRILLLAAFHRLNRQQFRMKHGSVMAGFGCVAEFGSDSVSTLSYFKKPCIRDYKSVHGVTSDLE
jgi:hypothetical protein